MVQTLNLGATAFDGLLCLTLVFIAWLLVRTPDLVRAVMLFFAFGLLVSVAWVRLNAVDVALAEAIIGAGLTGAMFLAALSRLGKASSPQAGPAAPETRSRTPQPHDREKT